MLNTDYIVIGGGSSGCVITARLIEAGKSVLLLEAGPADKSIWIDAPAGLFKALTDARTWKFMTDPEPGALGRKLPMMQGKVLGGGSSVNGMIYLRGQQDDYDGWEALGCTGWSFADVLPYFKRSEDNQLFVNPFHEPGGPLKVSRSRYNHPLATAFLRAAQQAGIPYNDDFNGVRQEGVGFFPSTSFEGHRQSTSVAFLSRVRHSPLLTLCTEATVDSLILENGAAAGIRYRRKGDATLFEARANNEVVVSAGAFGSPKLLQLSGIGPGLVLAEHGIAVRREIDAVGKGFQDHFNVPVKARTGEPISMMGEDKGLRGLRNGLQWLLFKSGILGSPFFEIGAFADTDGGGRPDVQFHLFPALLPEVGESPSGDHGLTLSACVLRPLARGEVSIRSADPRAQVRVISNLFNKDADVAVIVRGVRLARKVIAMPALRQLLTSELGPGELGQDLPDERLAEHARAAARTVFHPCGTCRMGGDEGSVVDSTLRVRGVSRLRVADASIFPSLVSANTNAASIMVGERCADFLLGKAP